MVSVGSSFRYSSRRGLNWFMRALLTTSLGWLFRRVIVLTECVGLISFRQFPLKCLNLWHVGLSGGLLNNFFFFSSRMLSTLFRILKTCNMSLLFFLYFKVIFDCSVEARGRARTQNSSGHKITGGTPVERQGAHKQQG